jgi:Ca2+-binding RTX toxin-like protein
LYDRRCQLLIGQAGGDHLYGGDGNDQLWGDVGIDELVGGNGDDRLDGGDDTDSLTGESGIDELIGGGDTDFLYGGLDNDRIYGGDGQDYLRGDDGDDLLEGGQHDDRLVGGAGADTLVGGDGTDTASYSGATSAVLIDLMKAPTTWMGDAYGDTFTSIEELTLTSFDDIFRGNDSANHLRAQSGDDQLYGLGGDDILIGGSGNDSLYGGNGDDIVSGDGAFRAFGNDYLQGNAGDDELAGGRGNDRIAGGTGNDILRGGLDGDYLVGNENADIFQYYSVEESQNAVFDGISQLDQIVDFAQGQDTIDLSTIDANVILDGDQAFLFLADPGSHAGDWAGYVWAIANPQSGYTSLNVSIDADAEAEMQIYMSRAYIFTPDDLSFDSPFDPTRCKGAAMAASGARDRAFGICLNNAKSARAMLRPEWYVRRLHCQKFRLMSAGGMTTTHSEFI